MEPAMSETCDGPNCPSCGQRAAAHVCHEGDERIGLKPLTGNACEKCGVWFKYGRRKARKLTQEDVPRLDPFEALFVGRLQERWHQDWLTQRALDKLFVAWGAGPAPKGPKPC